MPDIRTLLHDAAPQPLGPLDMAAVRARAARRSPRRLLAWIVGLAALVGSVPVGNAVLVSAGPGEQGATVDQGLPTDLGRVVDAEPDGRAPDGGRATTDSDLPAPGDTDQAGGPAATTPPAQVPGAGSGEIPSTAPAARSEPSTTSTTSTSLDSYGYPPARSCSVDNEGLDYGEERSCRFTATAPGGWNYYQPPHLPSVTNIPHVEITVSRDGRTFTYRTRKVYDQPGGGYRLEGCADDIIEPGDFVHVMIVEPHDAWMDLRTEMGAGAGEHWGCTDSGP